MRLLVVEDERSMNEIIKKRLEKEGYSVDNCFDGSEALLHLNCAEYDAVILDIMLPKIDGIEVLRRMRRNEDKTPVLLLTARDSIEDRVAGLDAGADDYLIKPFSFDELLARIRVLIRRATVAGSNRLTLGDLTVDCDARTVKRGDVQVELTGKEFDILEFLLRNTGTVLSRERICRHLWSYDYEGGSNIVDVYIRYLRRKLDEGYDNKLIHTVRGAGYVLREEK